MQPETNVLPWPIIPRKPADNRVVAYRCIQCSMSTALPNDHGYAVYCGCGAEMRPVDIQQSYSCKQCGNVVTLMERPPYMMFCDGCRCPDQMRPVEG